MSLLIILLLIYLIYVASKPKAVVNDSPDLTERTALTENNKRWTRLIYLQKLSTKNKYHKDVLDKTLKDALAQGLINPEYLDSLENNDSQYESVLEEAKKAPAVRLDKSNLDLPVISDSVDSFKPENSEKKRAKAAKLDSISILLYFGAFLFVASVGLFVAFAGADGWVRALSVLILCLALYVVGHWIYRTKAALKPAGLAFIGIGVAIAPLVGVTVYSYVDKTNPQLVWLITSLFCLGLYSHAIFKIRQPLLDYLFIFTLLSLFESSVAVLDFPTYYFGWVMVAVGLLLQLLSQFSNLIPDFRGVSKSGGALYVPLAIFVSLVLLADGGFSQLGVTLSLASLYYGLVYRSSSDEIEGSYSALASQISFMAGMGSLFYGYSNSILATGIFLTAMSVAHIPVILLKSAESIIARNFATCMLALSLVCLPLTFTNLVITSVLMFVVVLQGLVVWWHQNRSDSYFLAGIFWTFLPLVLGQLGLSPSLSANWQAIWLVISIAIHIIFFLLGALPKSFSSIDLLSGARSVLIFNVVVVLIFSLSLSPLFSLGFLAVIGLLTWILTWFDRHPVWSLLSGLAISTSVISTWDSPILSLSVIVSLIFNILLSLRFRSESNRWISTALWLILPLALGGYPLSEGWTAGQYGWFYLAVMLGLIISRMIARGGVFASSKIPIAAYARNASMSYVAGYTIAGIISFILALVTLDNILSSVLILSLLSMLIFITSWLVEKRPEILLLQPLLWQVILFALIGPNNTDTSLSIFLALSTVLSLITYLISNSILISDMKVRLVDENVLVSSLLTSFIAPMSYMFIGKTDVFMIIGLFVSSLMLYHYWRYRSQGHKEFAISLSVLSVLWLLYYLGLRELQAYTHIIALTLAGFAWWRHIEGDGSRGNEYIYCALGTATIPLVMQALSDQSGGLYGWWLLIEQVVFMLIGISIRKKFVVMWGLYVAIASVLYQLRNLGFAALAVLACFVIGIAIYQLQKYNKPD